MLTIIQGVAGPEPLAPLQRLSGALLAALWLLVVLHLLLALPLLRTLAIACLGGFLACAVPRASLHIRLLCLVTAAAAAWDIAGTGDWTPVRRGLESGIIFGAFIPTIMLLRATADESPLLAATRARIDGWGEGQRELWVQAVAHLLGSFLMIGGYVIARSALPAELPEARRVRLAESATRGLGLAICWSPFFVSSAIASQLVPSVPRQLVVLGLDSPRWAGSCQAVFYRQLDAAAMAIVSGAARCFRAFGAARRAGDRVESRDRVEKPEAIVLMVPVCASVTSPHAVGLRRGARSGASRDARAPLR